MLAEGVYRQIIAAVDKKQDQLESFLKELVEVPSVNPWFGDSPNLCKEQEAQQVVACRLEKQGAQIDLWEPNAEELACYKGRPGYYTGRDFTNRPNLVAKIAGSGDGSSLLFSGHIDVVSAGSGWETDPFQLVRKGEKLIGRGTVDMKGGIAAMVIALEALLEAGFKLKGDILVSTVVDEEAGGMGTLALIDRGYRADACIIGEPTNLTIAPLCRGILWGKLTIRGRSGHIELPQDHWTKGGAVDAIALARVYMDHFDRFNADWALRKCHPLLPIPCQLAVAQLNAGEYPTAYANQAEIVFNVQYLPQERDEFNLGGRVKAEIEEFVQKVAQTEPWLQKNPPCIEWLVDADCAETPAEHPFVTKTVQAVETLGREAKLQGLSCHTDMGWFINSGIATVNLGPGNGAVAHQNNEYVLAQDLLDAARAYALIIADWCGVS